MNYIPNLVVKAFDEVDFVKLYEEGYKIIISDLDNTLAPYTLNQPNDELITKINSIKKIGFKIYLVSNNKEKRLKTFVDILKLDGFLAKANKPNPKKLNNFMIDKHILKEEVIALGDQLVTDVLGFNRCGLYSVLVKTIDQKTQKWYTKINRLREKRIIKRIKKINLDIGRKIEEL